MLQQQLPARIVQPNAGTSVRIVTDVVTLKAVGDDTGGAYSLFETRTPPKGGTPRHVHHYEDEAFYVLEGSYAFEIGDEKVVLGPGGYAMAPRETVHAFRNAGDGIARMLVWVVPGGYRERFFIEAGEPVSDPANPEPPDGPPDFDRVRIAAARYGTESVQPPTE